MNSKTCRIVCGIFLWAAAALLAAFAVWAFIESADIISQAKATGQLAGSGSGYVIISFYMSNSLVYLVYALALAALGLLVQKKDTITAARVEDHLVTHATQSEERAKEPDDLPPTVKTKDSEEGEDSDHPNDSDEPDDVGDALKK